MLPRVLEIGRALRPLMRLVPSRRHLVLDEAETVRRIAEQEVWAPVLKPAAERRFDLALVVETGPSMVLWRSTLTQLRLLLERQGAFRDVRTWTLGLEPDRAGRVVISRGGAAGTVGSFPPESLVVLGNERMILLAGDGLSAPWRDGSVLEALRLWGRHHPTAVMQMLPPRLWPGTGMDLPVVELRCPAGGVANIRLAVQGPSPRRRSRRRRKEGDPSPVPVVWLEPEAVRRWARLVAGPEGSRAPGLLLHDEPPSGTPPEDAPESAPTQEDAERLLRLFWAAASLPARQLAGYLSAVPLSLPTMRHVQRTLLPDSRPEHLAEVFLGGLLRRTTPEGADIRDDDVRYDFLPHIRELLLSTLPADEALQVLKIVNDYLAEWGDDTFDFRAILADPVGATSRPISASARPFALISVRVLGRLGAHLARAAGCSAVPRGTRWRSPRPGRRRRRIPQGRRPNPPRYRPAAQIPTDDSRAGGPVRSTPAGVRAGAHCSAAPGRVGRDAASAGWSGRCEAADGARTLSRRVARPVAGRQIDDPEHAPRLPTRRGARDPRVRGAGDQHGHRSVQEDRLRRCGPTRASVTCAGFIT